MTKPKQSNSEGEVRVRFAPSPTGDLHVGGVRTALFNYLFARHHNGKFLLRIEDTDIRRSTPEAIQVILEGMKWMGLEHDEEIVYQASRIERHKEAAQQLLNSGAAYPAFETTEELAAKRDEAQRTKSGYMYDRTSLNLSADEVQMRIDRGDPYVVRLRVVDEDITFTDGVHTDITVSGKEIEDFIILRSDGTPTYMLAVVVDDADMGITHVIRGDDHISNTPKQIMLYRALGLEIPIFAHVPLILGIDRRKLSKRHGVTSIMGYRDAGFLPETITNYLGLLGWSPGDDRNEITMPELIDLFDVNGIQSSSAVFDDNKLLWLNGHYISQLSYANVASDLNRFAIDAVKIGKLDAVPSKDKIKSAWELLNNRIHLTSDLFDTGLYMFRDPTEYDPKGMRKNIKTGTDEQLLVLADDFGNLNNFDVDSIEEIVRDRARNWEISGGKLIHPLRLAVSGVTGGPSLFDMLESLGRDTVIRRIKNCVKFIQLS